MQTVITLITYIKNMMLSNEEIESLGKKENLPLAEIYKAYCGELRRQSLMDYDDQMVYAYTMLKTTHRFWNIFKICTNIFAWTKHRIHQKSSTKLLKYLQ